MKHLRSFIIGGWAGGTEVDFIINNMAVAVEAKASKKNYNSAPEGTSQFKGRPL